jgi:Bacterial mobilisation protein (MobC)
MSDCTQLKTWVTKETKDRFAAVARHQGLSDSALLKRLVGLMLQTANAGQMAPNASVSRSAPESRLTVRLRADDQLLLRERAAARAMPAATYVSVLIRAHLRSLAPLPKEELLAFKRVISELGRIGRNLNQIAHAANQGQRVAGPGPGDLRAIVRVCEGLRDHVKRLTLANVKAWDEGHGDPNG